MGRYLLRFSKVDRLKYISHLDLLRLFQRAFKRAGVQLRYSEGYNPHARIAFTHPLSLGFESEAEYLELETTVPYRPEEIVEMLRPQMPGGLGILSCHPLVETSKTSTAAAVDFASYRVIWMGREDPDESAYENKASVVKASMVGKSDERGSTGTDPDESASENKASVVKTSMVEPDGRGSSEADPDESAYENKAGVVKTSMAEPDERGSTGTDPDESTLTNKACIVGDQATRSLGDRNSDGEKSMVKELEIRASDNDHQIGSRSSERIPGSDFALLAQEIAPMMKETELLHEKFNRKKKKTVVSDIRPHIHSMSAIVTDDHLTLSMMLRTGSRGNLNPEVPVEILCARCGVTYDRSEWAFCRTEMFFMDGRTLLPMTEFPG